MASLLAGDISLKSFSTPDDVIMAKGLRLFSRAMTKLKRKLSMYRTQPSGMISATIASMELPRPPIQPLNRLPWNITQSLVKRQKTCSSQTKKSLSTTNLPAPLLSLTSRSILAVKINEKSFHWHLICFKPAISVRTSLKTSILTCKRAAISEASTPATRNFSPSQSVSSPSLAPLFAAK